MTPDCKKVWGLCKNFCLCECCNACYLCR